MIELAKTIARNMLPRSFFETGRCWAREYRNWQRQRSPKLSEEELLAILTEQLGVRPGSVVFVHSSIDGMHLGFSFGRVLPLLQEVVGTDGTLLFPCYYSSGRAEEALRRGEVFDVRNTITNMGVISELARRNTGACRSLHPTNSIVALGKYARELTETHQNSIYPCGEESPYYKIVHYNGLIIGLGVTTASISFSHAVEDVMRDQFPMQTRTTEVFNGRVIDWDGRERVIQTLAAHKNTHWRNGPKYFRRHIPPQIARDVRIKGVNFFTARAKELAEQMTELAKQGITIYNYH